MAMMLQRLIAACGQTAVHSLDEVQELLDGTAKGDFALNAAVLGARTTQLGFAFAAGYPLAVRRLTGDARPLALAVTEARGNRPTDIDTVLRRDANGSATISGTKTFVTLADRASHCLVLCKDGDAAPAADGRVALLLVLAPLRAHGVSVDMLPSLPIAPAIAHGKVTFTNTTVERIFDGDGWNDYGRPFRTIEDVAVMSAALGMAFRITFQSAPTLAARAIAILAALRDVERLGFSDREAHVLLSGALALATPLLADVCRAASDDVRIELERDLPLLSIATRAREARTARAWQSFS